MLGLALITGCTETPTSPETITALCQSEITPIADLQGSGYTSPFEGTGSTVRGVITRVLEGEGAYLEESGLQRSPDRSKAIFVSDKELSLNVLPGEQVVISGRVSELGSSRDTLTSLSDVSEYQTCAENRELPLTPAELPLNSTEREAFEGMRLSFYQELTVSDVYNLYRGELTLSSGGILRVPTEVRTPGAGAMALARENRDQSLVVARPDSGNGAISVGSTIGVATGVMGHDGRNQQLLLGVARFDSAPAPELPEPLADGAIRIVNSNLLNFFNGDGRGGGFPTERGAESLEDFIAQSARIRAAMAIMQPDLLAVQELENDGFGPDSAAHSLLEILDEATGGGWAVVTPQSGRIGGDVITVGLFYREKVLEPFGPATVLDGPEFQQLNRQPLTQLFRERRTGKKFLVAVNHLKSKGRCPDDGENSDQQDGQNCWNHARLSAVGAQVPWLEKLAGEMGTENILILGDMNAWRKEDPIRQFSESGYVDLVEQVSGLPQHSFLYWGQTGTLDYAFASSALAGYAKRAEIWHINATWPQKMVQAQPWLRASDHDPVIVDFDFSHSATSD